MTPLKSGMFTIAGWKRFFLYCIFIFSTFSIAGTDASIVMLYLLTLLQLFRERRLPGLESSLLGIMLLYTAIAVVSGMLNEYPVNHLEALRDNWRLLLPFVLLPILDSEDENLLLWVFFVFLSLIALYGIIQLFTGADWFRPAAANLSAPYRTLGDHGVSLYHAKGNYTHHLTYGGVLLLCSPLLSSFAFCKYWNPGIRWLAGGMAILLWTAALSSLGRSIWLGAAAAVIILMCRFSPKLMFAGVLIFGGLMSMLFLYSGENNTGSQSVDTRLGALRHRMVSGFSLQDNRDRLLMWKSASQGIQDHFWLGIGHDADQRVMTPYREVIQRETGHRFQNAAGVGVHNIYLQTWLNYGLFGFLSFLGIWIIFFRGIILGLKETTPFDFRNSVLWGAISGVSGFLVAGFFENNFRDGEVQTTLMLIIALALFQRKKNAGRYFSRLY